MMFSREPSGKAPGVTSMELQSCHSEMATFNTSRDIEHQVFPGTKTEKQLSATDEVMTSAVFLDRDGVINALVYHEEQGIIDSPFSPQQFKLIPGVPEAIELLPTTRLFDGAGIQPAVHR